MLREKKKFRPSVPNNVLRVKNMWESVLSARYQLSNARSSSSSSGAVPHGQSFDSSTSVLTCNICEIVPVKEQPLSDEELQAVSGFGPDQEEQFLRGSMFQCSFCTLSLHVGCEKRILLKHIRSLDANSLWGQPSLENLENISVPPIFCHEEPENAAPCRRGLSFLGLQQCLCPTSHSQKLALICLYLPHLAILQFDFKWLV